MSSKTNFVRAQGKRVVRLLSRHFGPRCRCAAPYVFTVNAREAISHEPRCERCGCYVRESRFTGFCRAPRIVAAIESMRATYRGIHNQPPPKPLTPTAGTFGPRNAWSPEAIEEAVSDIGRKHRDDGERCGDFREGQS